MNIDANIKFKNNYRLQHIDTITGEILHDLEFHNVVLDQIIDTVIYGSNYSNEGFGIAIGNGSGTPSTSDTQLFHEIKKFLREREGVTGKCSKENNNTLLFSISITIPASASEVYDISEVGVCFQKGNNGSYVLVTHALILDSEGNPITVKKKDTDKIILNCEVYITFESEGIENFDVEVLLKNSLFSGTLAIQYLFGAATSLEAQRVSDAYFWSNYQLNYINCPSTYVLPRPSWVKDKNAKTITVNFGPSRLPEYSMPVYIRGITFGKLGTIKLPNETIFPRYKISNITVGVGDGVRTKFKCPLNYFIQDSETIRVGAEEKIRNTDYTIDNEANQDELIELSAGNEAIISGGLYQYTYRLPFFRKPFGKIPSGGSDKYGKFGQNGFDPSHPLYLDFKESVKLNTLRVPLNSSGITFTLFGRDTEEEDWTLIGQFTPNNTNNHYNFDLCYYRYIKLTSTKLTHDIGLPGNNDGYNENYNTIEKCKKGCYFIGYVGDGIEFTTPPPPGAAITMDAYTDLPFISPNNVLDLSATLTFHF